jgi:hypothetical protein
MEFKDYVDYNFEELLAQFLYENALQDKFVEFCDKCYFDSKYNKHFATIKMPSEAQLLVFKFHQKQKVKDLETWSR